MLKGDGTSSLGDGRAGGGQRLELPDPSILFNENGMTGAPLSGGGGGGMDSIESIVAIGFKECLAENERGSGIPEGGGGSLEGGTLLSPLFISASFLKCATRLSDGDIIGGRVGKGDSGSEMFSWREGLYIAFRFASVDTERGGFGGVGLSERWNPVKAPRLVILFPASPR